MEPALVYCSVGYISGLSVSSMAKGQNHSLWPGSHNPITAFSTCPMITGIRACAVKWRVWGLKFCNPLPTAYQKQCMLDIVTPVFVRRLSAVNKIIVTYLCLLKLPKSVLLRSSAPAAKRLSSYGDNEVSICLSCHIASSQGFVLDGYCKCWAPQNTRVSPEALFIVRYRLASPLVPGAVCLCVFAIAAVGTRRHRWASLFSGLRPATSCRLLTSSLVFGCGSGWPQGLGAARFPSCPK